MGPTRLVLLFVIAWTSVAQQSDVPEFDVLSMPFHVALVRDLSSAKARVGDVVELKYFGEIRTSTAGVVLNSKAKLFGKVTDAAKRGRQQPEARLAIIVDRAEFEGKSIRLNAVFCGRFFSAPQVNYEPTRSGKPGRVMTIKPGKTSLPEDVELRRSPDETLGTILVSKKDNINIANTTRFFICQQRRDRPARVADTRVIAPPSSLAPGVKLLVALKQRLDAGIAKAGDVVAMTVVFDLISPTNTILIPKGADVTGKIIIAEPASKSSPSRLAIVAERVSWDGVVVPLNAFISHEPVLSEDMARAIISGTPSPADLRQIKLEKLSDGASVLSRPKKTINLPPECVLMVRQSD